MQLRHVDLEHPALSILIPDSWFRPSHDRRLAPVSNSSVLDQINVPSDFFLNFESESAAHGLPAWMSSVIALDWSKCVQPTLSDILEPANECVSCEMNATFISPVIKREKVDNSIVALGESNLCVNESVGEAIRTKVKRREVNVSGSKRLDILKKTFVLSRDRTISEKASVEGNKRPHPPMGPIAKKARKQTPVESTSSQRKPSPMESTSSLIQSPTIPEDVFQLPRIPKKVSTIPRNVSESPTILRKVVESTQFPGTKVPTTPRRDMHVDLPLVASMSTKSSRGDASWGPPHEGNSRGVPFVSAVGGSVDRKMAIPQPFEKNRKLDAEEQLHRNHEWEVVKQRALGHSGASMSIQRTERQRYCKSRGCNFFPPSVEKYIMDRIEARSSARRKKDFGESDAIRKELADGFRIVIFDFIMLWGVRGHFTREELALIDRKGVWPGSGGSQGEYQGRTFEDCDQYLTLKVKPTVHLSGQAHDSLPELSEEVSHNSSGDDSRHLRAEHHRNQHHYAGPLHHQQFSDGRQDHSGKLSRPPSQGFHRWKR